MSRSHVSLLSTLLVGLSLAACQKTEEAPEAPAPAPAAAPEPKAEGAVGAGLNFQGRELIFSNVYVGGPAARAGVMPGDKLLKIDGGATMDLSMNEAIKAVRGPVGTTVTLLVQHENEAPRELLLTREVVTSKVPVGWVPPADGGMAPVAGDAGTK